MPQINKGDLAGLEIPVPSIETQRHILGRLSGLESRIDASEGLQAETAIELNALLPSILGKAFKGEL